MATFKLFVYILFKNVTRPYSVETLKQNTCLSSHLISSHVMSCIVYYYIFSITKIENEVRVKSIGIYVVVNITESSRDQLNRSIFQKLNIFHLCHKTEKYKTTDIALMENGQMSNSPEILQHCSFRNRNIGRPTRRASGQVQNLAREDLCSLRLWCLTTLY